MNSIMAMATLYFPVKYFVYYIFDISPLDGLSLAELDSAARNLLLFFVPTYTCFYACKLLVGERDVRRIEFVERFNLGLVSYLTIGAMVLLAIAVKGTSVLRSPLEMRGLMELRGMAYLSIFMQFVTTYYLFRLLSDRAYVRLAVFGALFSGFALLSGRASLQVFFVLNLLFFANACYGRRIAGYCILLVMLGIPYVVVTGMYRNMARMSEVSLADVAEAVKSESAGGLLEFEMTRAFYRIDDLEELAELSNAMERNSELDVSFGGHAGEVLYQWIPRHFWPDKPLDFTMAMTRWFNPSVYYVGAGNNFTGIGELLFNFGPVGVIVGGIVFGFLMYWACAMWDACLGSPGMTFLQFGVIQPYLTLGLLAGFLNDLALPTLLVDLGLLILLLKFRVRRSAEGRGRTVRSATPTVPSLALIG